MHSFSEILQFVEQYTAANPFPARPERLYDPCNYIVGLGGKRLRPALALMAAELVGADPKSALPVGWAVELFHNFSLIHDDIMDAAPLRRGQPTVHTKWDLTTGILSGDVMLIYAYQHLIQVENKAAIPALVEVFNRVAIGVCEGQQHDMDFERRDDVTLEEYTNMIELKTAVLLGGALQMGALSGGADVETARKLYDFGRLAGIAFQIQDDLLDTYGDPATFGKQVGGDIIQNKKTFLTLKTLEVADEQTRKQFLALYQNTTMEPDQKVDAVRGIYNDCHIPELVEAAKREFEDRAFAELDAVAAPDENKSVLRGMVSQLLHRQH
jgi:geranylgeranyl diphosphate synthase, type II